MSKICRESKYLQNLPSDLSITVGNSIYQVNRRLFESFSSYIQRHRGDHLIMPFKDRRKTFEQVIKHIYGHKIEIKSEFRNSIYGISLILGIKKLTEAASSKSFANDIIFKIVQRFPDKYDDLYQTISDNIEVISTSESFEFIPIEVAERILNDRSANFYNDNSRINFATKILSALVCSEKEVFNNIFKIPPKKALEVIGTFQNFDENSSVAYLIKSIIEREDELKNQNSFGSYLSEEYIQIGRKIIESAMLCQNIAQVAEKFEYLVESANNEDVEIAFLSNDEMVSLKLGEINQNLIGLFNKIDKSVCASLSSIKKSISNLYPLIVSFKTIKCDGNSVIGLNNPDLNHEIRIFEGVAKIGPSAFENSKISSIKLPSSLFEIGKCAFKGCSSLQSITIHLYILLYFQKNWKK